MATNNNRPVPFKATHPGEMLHDELEERGINNTELAKMMDVPVSQIDEFVNCERGVDIEFARKLEKALNIPCDVWMDIYEGYLYDCKAIAERELNTLHTVRRASTILNHGYSRV